MAKFNCTVCPETKEYNDVLTMKFRSEGIRYFDKDNNPVDECVCGGMMEQEIKKDGFGGFVSNGRGGTGNFKRS